MWWHSCPTPFTAAGTRNSILIRCRTIIICVFLYDITAEITDCRAWCPWVIICWYMTTTEDTTAQRALKPMFSADELATGLASDLELTQDYATNSFKIFQGFFGRHAWQGGRKKLAKGAFSHGNDSVSLCAGFSTSVKQPTNWARAKIARGVRYVRPGGGLHRYIYASVEHHRVRLKVISVTVPGRR